MLKKKKTKNSFRKDARKEETEDIERKGYNQKKEMMEN